MIILLLLLFQIPIPPPVDRGRDMTHKTTHDRTVFYMKDGKTPCGTLMEFKNGAWYGYVYKFGGIRSEAFKTRPEAVTWLKVSCPVQGKVVLK